MTNPRPDIESLRRRSAKTLRLPKQAQALIDHYANLRIMGARTSCPYHINCRLFSRNRALVGKGRPEEIEATATKFFRRLNTTIEPQQSEKLKASLRDYGIGVDCSGFAAWVLNELTLCQLGKPIWKCLKFSSLKRRVISRARPVENISATLLTGQRNAQTINDIRAVRPGNMIRALGGGHVIIVSEVGIDAEGRAFYFEYWHSAAGNEQVSGVSNGLVVLRDPGKGLAHQAWPEADTKIAPALVAVRAGGDDSRLVRLRVLAAEPIV